MANELQKLQNPDNVPGAVTSGYQRQNTNIYAIQTGLDTTEPYDNGNGVVTIPAGGIVECNGVMFKIATNVSLNKTNPTMAYWIEVIDDGITASLSLVPRPGIWNSEKKGCYFNNNRTLNWVSLGNISNIPNTDAEYSRTNSKGDYIINLAVGWKYAALASGNGPSSPSSNGGNGGNGAGSNSNGGTAGGGGTATTPKTTNKIFFYDNKQPLKIHIGAHGTNGGSGGAGGSSGGVGSSGGGGGGGGCGAGEETYIEGIVSTDSTPSGIPGNGGNPGGTTSSAIGGAGGRAMQIGNNGFSNTGYYSTRGGNIGSSGVAGAALSGAGGSGGGGGLDGINRANGSSGGYCNIYKLEN
jgi:hypothetical protein